MRRALALAGAAAVLVAGCSLIVDTDSVRRNRDAGATGGGSGGGSTGGGAGGGGGGGGSGGGTVVSYDGGPRCTGSMRPHLRCDPAITLATGMGPYYNAALGSVSQGLVAAWSDPAGFHLSVRELDGGLIAPLVEEAAGAVKRVTLATEGDAWAAIYDTGANTPLRCFSSASDAGTTAGNAGTTLISSVAVAANGAVAVVVAQPSNTLDWGISPAGCPSSRQTVAFGNGPDTDSASVVHIAGTGAEGFRFLAGAGFNGNNSGTGLFIVQPDGGLEFSSTAVFGEVMEDQNSAISANGDWALLLYGWENFIGAGDYGLSIRGFPTNADMPPDVRTRIGTNPSWWSVAGCGPGCTATAWQSSDAPIAAQVFFTTDDGDVRPVTTSDAGWDALCNTTVDATSIGVVYARGRLHLLVAEPTKLRMLSCDLPPL